MQTILSASVERVHKRIVCRRDLPCAGCCRDVLQRAPCVYALCSDSRCFLSLRRSLHASNSDLFYMRNLSLNCLAAAAALAVMAGCAQIKKPATQAKAMPAGLHFDQVGSVTLYVGEPCTPQIMFDFHGARSTVGLAAPRHETDLLTAAANKNQRVHVSGRWRRGGQSNCSYVQVTTAELMK